MGKTIILISAVPWEGIAARPHHFAREFADRGNKVLFVEPPITWLSPLKKPALAEKIHFGQVRLLGENLASLTPPPALPGGYRWRSFNRINQLTLARSVKRALRNLKWPQGIIFTHLPGTADYPWEEPIIYDCVDDHAAFSEYSSLWKKVLVNEMEKVLLERARGVLASSQMLWERCRKVRSDILLVGNGADADHFASAALGKTGRLGATNRIAGFYGGIGPWVDLELIFRAAGLLPEWLFYLAGPIESSVRLPKLPPNVRMPGLVAYADLPSILADFDAALIPFRLNELTASVNPLKLYEYFAAGKPVLVTPIPELTRWGRLVYPFSTAEELAESLPRALQEAAELKTERQKVAMEHSWSAKLDTILRYLDGLGL